jgi:hypothetical protein
MSYNEMYISQRKQPELMVAEGSNPPLKSDYPPGDDNQFAVPEPNGNHQIYSKTSRNSLRNIKQTHPGRLNIEADGTDNPDDTCHDLGSIPY